MISSAYLKLIDQYRGSQSLTADSGDRTSWTYFPTNAGSCSRRLFVNSGPLMSIDIVLKLTNSHKLFRIYLTSLLLFLNGSHDRGVSHLSLALCDLPVKRHRGQNQSYILERYTLAILVQTLLTYLRNVLTLFLLGSVPDLYISFFLTEVQCAYHLIFIFHINTISVDHLLRYYVSFSFCKSNVLFFLTEVQCAYHLIFIFHINTISVDHLLLLNFYSLHHINIKFHISAISEIYYSRCYTFYILESIIQGVTRFVS